MSTLPPKISCYNNNLSVSWRMHSKKESTLARANRAYSQYCIYMPVVMQASLTRNGAKIIQPVYFAMFFCSCMVGTKKANLSNGGEAKGRQDTLNEMAHKMLLNGMDC